MKIDRAKKGTFWRPHKHTHTCHIFMYTCIPLCSHHHTDANTWYTDTRAHTHTLIPTIHMYIPEPVNVQIT